MSTMKIHLNTPNGSGFACGMKRWGKRRAFLSAQGLPKAEFDRLPVEDRCLKCSLSGTSRRKVDPEKAAKEHAKKVAQKMRDAIGPFSGESFRDFYTRRDAAYKQAYKNALASWKP